MHLHPQPPVLLIDDNLDDLYLTRRLLAKADLKNPVVCVEGGAEAITFLTGAIAEDSLPCLVLLDIKMPVCDGFEVLKWARHQKALDHTAIVMHSSSGDDRDRTRAKKLGATDYLVKLATLSEARKLLQRFCVGEPSDERGPGGGKST